MVRMMVLLVAADLLLCGCGQKVDPEVARIEAEVDSVIVELRTSGMYNPWWKYMKMINAITNREVRVKCCALKRCKLLSVELRGDDYKGQARLFTEVLYSTLPNPSVKVGHWSFEDEYDAEIERLAWARRQLDRWKSMVGETSARMKIENPKKYEDWRVAYSGCLSSYEGQVRMVELGFERKRKSWRVLDPEYAKVKQKLENFLGRPIRSREELLGDSRSLYMERFEEWKAIR